MHKARHEQTERHGHAQTPRSPVRLAADKLPSQAKHAAVRQGPKALPSTNELLLKRQIRRFPPDFRTDPSQPGPRGAFAHKHAKEKGTTDFRLRGNTQSFLGEVAGEKAA